MSHPSSPVKDMNAENLLVNPKRQEVCNRKKIGSKVTHLPLICSLIHTNHHHNQLKDQFGDTLEGKFPNFNSGRPRIAMFRLSGISLESHFSRLKPPI